MNPSQTRNPATAPRGGPVRGRAALPNDPGLDRLLADTQLGSTAKAVAVALVKNWAWYKDSCFPADKTIALKVGKSPGHVQRCLRQLERAGYVDREHTPEVRSGRRIRLLWRGPEAGRGARAESTPARSRGAAPARNERVEVEQGGVEQNAGQSSQRQRPGTPAETPLPLLTTALDRVMNAAGGPTGTSAGSIPPEGVATPSRPVAKAPPRPQTPTPKAAPAPAFAAAPPPAPARPEATGVGTASDLSRGVESLPPAALTAEERARYRELPEPVRRRVSEWLGLGDRICAAEARRLLSPPPPPEPPAWSLATAELLAGLPGRPDRVAAAAGRLASELGDPGGYQYYHSVAAAVCGRRGPASALVSAWRQGTGPRSSRPGAVFATAWKREARSTG